MAQFFYSSEASYHRTSKEEARIEDRALRKYKKKLYVVVVFY